MNSRKPAAAPVPDAQPPSPGSDAPATGTPATPKPTVPAKRTNERKGPKPAGRKRW
jgi:hypothetical protein